MVSWPGMSITSIPGVVGRHILHSIQVYIFVVLNTFAGSVVKTMDLFKCTKDILF
jgi:hypothetical protein